MCGRYTLTLDESAVQMAFDLQGMPAGYQPRYNIAPTQAVLVISDERPRRAEWMRWGLIPSWAKDLGIGSRLINARAETLSEKPAFRQAFARRRCLILADGFYEWQRPEVGRGGAVPYYFRRTDRGPFAFAGLWEVWKPPEGEALRSCTIITCQANTVISEIHERMPVMLSAAAGRQWLEDRRPDELQGLLAPFPPEEMEAYPVARLVNDPKRDAAECIRPAG